MSSTKHLVESNSGHSEPGNTTKPTSQPRGAAPENDSENIVDEELDDSYEFVEADYHSYSDVASSVTTASCTDSEFSQREDEIVAGTENNDDEHSAEKRGIVETQNRETAVANNSSDMDTCNEEVDDKTKVGHALLSSCHLTENYRMCGSAVGSQSMRLAWRGRAVFCGGEDWVWRTR
jgi:hypothetical protein